MPVLLVFVPVADATHGHSALVATLERPQLLVHHHDVLSQRVGAEKAAPADGALVRFLIVSRVRSADRYTNVKPKLIINVHDVQIEPGPKSA